MRLSACRSVFLALFLFFAAFDAEAAEMVSGNKKNELGSLPPFSKLEIYQIGDSDLIIGIGGKELPMPETAFNGNKTEILLKEVRLDSADMDARSQIAPMLTHLGVEQQGRNVLVSITTELPLALRGTRGSAPSDSYTLRLITQSQRQKIVEEPVATQSLMRDSFPTGPFASTTPITLDLRDTELRDVFRMLGLHLKKNVIIDPSLPPALVTMTLKNVPLKEAFSYLMKTYDVGYQMVGKDTILIGTNDGLSKVAGTEETRAFHVAYADPAAVQGLLVNLARMPADRLIVDPYTRTIYATTSGTKLAEIATILQKLDRPGKQVMLSARILEFSDGVTQEVQTAVNAVYDHWWFKYMNGIGGGGYIDDNRIGRNYKTPTKETGIVPIITDPVAPMQGIWREFDIAFQATETKGLGKTLASPSVITLDGKEAVVKLTEDYPYISGRDDGGNPSWSSQSVGPQMKLTPIVGRDDIITINLTIETGEVIEMIAGSNGEQMPRTSNRSVTTNVRVRNGEPFVVGGLFRENRSNQRVRIPVLGQIPILGELFTYRKSEHKKTQVVMLVIPYILETPDVAVENEVVMHKR